MTAQVLDCAGRQHHLRVSNRSHRMVYPQKGGKRTALEEKGRKDRGSGEIISTGQRAQFPCGCPEEGRKCVRDIVEGMYGTFVQGMEPSGGLGGRTASGEDTGHLRLVRCFLFLFFYQIFIGGERRHARVLKKGAGTALEQEGEWQHFRHG